MIFPVNHLTGAKTPVFLTNCLASSSNPNLTATKLQHKKPKHQLQKAKSRYKIKPNETKAWFSRLSH